jgi:hypothetical protein
VRAQIAADMASAWADRRGRRAGRERVFCGELAGGRWSPRVVGVGDGCGRLIGAPTRVLPCRMPVMTPGTKEQVPASTSRQANQRDAANWTSITGPQRPAPLTTPPGRTRLRADAPAVKHPATGHAQPWQNRRARPRRPHPGSVRTHDDHVKCQPDSARDEVPVPGVPMSG